MAEKLSPRDAKTFDQVCRLQRDNKDFKSGETAYWIITDGHEVSLAEQVFGEAARQDITIPRVTFNRIVDWYTKAQALRRD